MTPLLMASPMTSRMASRMTSLMAFRMASLIATNEHGRPLSSDCLSHQCVLPPGAMGIDFH